MTRNENNIVLFSITLCWAASYVFIKSLPPDLSSYAYLTLTTGTASVVLVIVFAKQLKKLNLRILGQGFLMSLLMAGIDQLPSSNASFISSLNILFVPLLLLMLHRYPTRNNMLGIPIILFGLALTSGFELRGFLNTGTFYMIVACLFMAVYTISADYFTKSTDPLLLGVTQMCFTAIIGFLLWLIEEPQTFASIEYTRELLSSVFILAFFAKAYAYIMLMYSQRYTSPVSVTIIASTEPIVTLLLALLIPASFGAKEVFHLESLLGAMFIMAGAIVAGTNFLDKRKEQAA